MRAGIIILALLVLLVLSCAEVSEGPPALWSMTQGGSGEEGVYGLAATSGGHYAVVGFSNSSGAGGYDVHLLLTDALGHLVWERTYGGGGNERGERVVEAPGGGFFLAGFTNSPAAAEDDIFLAAADSAGNLLWWQTYGGAGEDFGEALSLSPDNTLILAGVTTAEGRTDTDLFIMKTDLAGKVLWQRALGGQGNDRAESVLALSDGGGLAVGGSWTQTSAEREAYAVRFDAQGQVLWQRTYGGAGWQRAECVIAMREGGYLIAGGVEDLSLYRIDEEGNLLWEAKAGGSAQDTGNSALQLQDGSILVAGLTESYGSGGVDMYLARFTSSGELLWQRAWGTGKDDFLGPMAMDQAGNIVIGGSLWSGTDHDLYLLKTDREAEYW